MDFLKDLARSISETVRERLSNPLLGAFLFAWIPWNYKLLLIVLGNTSAMEKITMIEFVAYPGPYCKLLFGIVYPLLTSTAFVFLYPFINRRITVFHKEQQILTYEKILSTEKTTTITLEQRDQLILRQKEKEIAYREQIEKLRTEVSDLETALREKAKQNVQNQSPPTSEIHNDKSESSDETIVTPAIDAADSGAKLVSSESPWPDIASGWEKLSEIDRAIRLADIRKNTRVEYTVFRTNGQELSSNKASELTGIHAAILYLASIRDCEEGFLSRQLKISSGNVTSILKRMIEEGFLMPSPSSFRGEFYSITRIGISVLQQLLLSYGLNPQIIDYLPTLRKSD